MIESQALNTKKSGYDAIEPQLDMIGEELQNHSSRRTEDNRLIKSIKTFCTLIVTISLGPLNYVLYKIMFDAYHKRRAFFVSNGINFLNVVFGGIALFVIDKQGGITHEMRQISHVKFMIIGFVDALGDFLQAMGANNTCGSLQQLLNQTIIPVTMIASWLMLKNKSTLIQIIGAIIIFVGAVIVMIPSFESPSHHHSLALISNLIYFSSNIPLAYGCVMKEVGFKELHAHVIYLTQWAAIYQLFFGLCFAPLQEIPGFTSRSGETLTRIDRDFWSGLKCYLHYDEVCHQRNTFVLLTGYCLVNFAFNMAGSYLVKQESAILNSISNALVLPLTVLAFDLPFLGNYKEDFSSMTIVGLIVVFTGFIIWSVDTFLQKPNEDSSISIEEDLGSTQLLLNENSGEISLPSEALSDLTTDDGLNYNSDYC